MLWSLRAWLGRGGAFGYGYAAYKVPDVKVKVEAASQLRDSLEHYTAGPIYPLFLKKLIPIFTTILKGAPVFVSISSEQV
jgi:hypothetical protein